MSKVRLAIIGNGMVGQIALLRILDKPDASLFDITPCSVKNPVKPMTVSTFRHPTSLTTRGRALPGA